MRYLNSYAFIILFLIFSYHNCIAQDGVTHDSSTVSFAENIFKSQIAQDALLYTGEEYQKYPGNLQGHPFFAIDQMEKGDILYNGILYKSIPLLYDIVRQVVVINRYNQYEKTQLINDKIKYFTIRGHTFENFFSSQGNDGKVSSVIYDEIFKGKKDIIVNRIKRIKNGIKAEDPTFFAEEDEVYVRDGNNLYFVNNKGSVLNAFGDKKDVMKTFIRKNNLKFKKNIEEDLIATAAYYSTLK